MISRRSFKQFSP